MTLDLPCIAPFDLKFSLAFLRGFGPMVGEQHVTNTAVTKALMHRGQPIAFTISQPERARPVLRCRLDSTRAIDAATEQAVVSRVRSFLSADEDLSPFFALAEQDACFAPVARRFRGFHHVKFLTPFEAACWGVINQRVPRSHARAMKAALVRELGGRVSLDGHTHEAFPEAERVAALSERDLLRLIGNERKARAVSGVAQAFAEVDETFLRTAPLEAVASWLRDIYGVGEFTCSFVLFRGLGRFYGQPMAERLTGAAEAVYGRKLSEAEFLKLSRQYGSWAGHWALHLWASTFAANTGMPGAVAVTAA